AGRRGRVRARRNAPADAAERAVTGVPPSPGRGDRDDRGEALAARVTAAGGRSGGRLSAPARGPAGGPVRGRWHVDPHRRPLCRKNGISKIANRTPYRSNSRTMLYTTRPPISRHYRTIV